MPAPAQHLEALTALLNCALEHCPANTARLIVGSAKPHIDALQAALAPPAGAVPPAAPTTPPE